MLLLWRDPARNSATLTEIIKHLDDRGRSTVRHRLSVAGRHVLGSLGPAERLDAGDQLGLRALPLRGDRRGCLGVPGAALPSESREPVLVAVQDRRGDRGARRVATVAAGLPDRDPAVPSWPVRRSGRVTPTAALILQNHAASSGNSPTANRRCVTTKTAVRENGALRPRSLR